MFSKKILAATVIIIVILATASVLIFTNIKNSSTNNNTSLSTTPTITSTKSPEPSSNPINTQITLTPSITTTPIANVKVFFSSSKNLDDTNVYSVNRQTSRTDVGTYVLEQYIAGPQASEAYLMNNIKLSGDSNCSGNDFSLNIDQNTKKATVKFCRNVPLSGVMSDAKLVREIDANLKQFPTVQKVVLYNKDGKCLIDYSGLNQCDK